MEIGPLKPLVLNPPLNITYINTLEETARLFEFLDEQVAKNDTTTGFDLETDPKKDFYFRRCRTVQFGRIDKQVVVDLLGLCNGDSDLLFAAQGEYGKNLYKAPKLQAFMQQLAPYVTGKLLLTGVNLGFELSTMYWNFGISPWNFFDTSVVERCIYAGEHSLKDYGFYGMEELVGRYLGYQVDKELQTSFTLDLPLSQAQIEYAALDTRLPIAIKTAQEFILKGETEKSLIAKGQKGWAKVLARLSPTILGDNLETIAKIENNAIPPFMMMHIHGERLDTVKWKARVEENKKELAGVIAELDIIFLPTVGSKNEAIDEAKIASLEVDWKTLAENRTDEEIQMKLELSPLKRAAKKNPLDMDLRVQIAELEIKISQWEEARKTQKETIKAQCSDLKKRRTQINKLKASCEGDALINYSSNAQLIKVLRTLYKQLAKIESLDDEVLEKYKKIRVITLIQKYHELAKLIGTYGDSWCTTWVTRAGKEEGWLNPGDGRLHSQFNSYDAETGRSSSSQPNGQNLPQDKAIRSCFVADEGHKLITIDCSGAELRILAEEANDPIWIDAFNKNQDVHSVCTELVEGSSYWKEIAEEGCAYYQLNEDGEPKRLKCKCKVHNQLRNSMKPVNFGIPYGIGPRSLSKQIGKSYAETLELMQKHKISFPNIWLYLDKSGSEARMLKKSFDMFGRRRLFPEPTWELAKQRLLEDEPEKFESASEIVEGNVAAFEQLHLRKPNKDELFFLAHHDPTSVEISKKYAMMHGNIERQGKNHRIQAANATIMKICMGSGFDNSGKPFLFHLLPQYGARVLKMVHDELVISAPESCAEEVAKVAEDAIARAAAMRMAKVKMTSEYHIADYWEK